MPILTTRVDSILTVENAALRTETACLKLTAEEFRSVQGVAHTCGQTRGEWMRDVILRAVRLAKSGDNVDPTLKEIVGVQLLLMNVLKPIAIGQPLTAAAFDSLVAEVHKLKQSVARKLVQEGK
jgi:hypothetical protein